jgi:hypothetical protein
MSAEPAVRPRVWSTVNFPMAGFFWFVGLLWLGLFAFGLAVTAGVAIWGEIESSVWEKAGGVVRFAAAFMVAWLVYTYLPIYVAHGVTRREFMQKLTVFTVAFSALLGALSMLGYLLEGLVYEVADWPHELTDEHSFDSTSELGTILVTHCLAFLVWATIGAIVGAAIYRHDDGWGLVALPVCIVLMIPAGFAIGSTELPLDRVFEDRTVDVLWAVVLCVLGAGAGLRVAWGLIREIPIRSNNV